jgi:COP9 signalosome complex subunit 1
VRLRVYILALTTKTLTGKTLVDRMVHIMNVSPQIAAHAATLAAREIPRTRNPALYGTVQQAYDVSRAMAASLGTEHPLTPEVVVVDSAWVDSVTARNNAERQKLEVELKGYTTNMIKESIRVGAVASLNED